jgi:hypothetical protein
MDILQISGKKILRPEIASLAQNVIVGNIREISRLRFSVMHSYDLIS